MNPKVNDVVQAMLLVFDDENTPAPVQDWIIGLVDRLRDSDTPDERFQKGTPIPPAVGAMADEYSVVRAERLRIEKVAKTVKERETELFNVILSTLNESPDNGAFGEAYSVQRVEKTVQNVKDWPSLWAYIRENDAFDLLGKSINKKAVEGRLEEGVALPGIEPDTIATLSFSKVSK